MEGNRSIFFSEAYLNLIASNHKWGLTSVREGSQVIGELYFCIVEKYGFVQIESLPFIPAINGMLYLPNDISEVNKKKKSRKILLQLFDQLPKYDNLNLKLGVQVEDTRSLSWHNYRQNVRFTSFFEPENLRTLESNYSKALRSKLNRSKRHVSIKMDDDYIGCYDILEKTFSRKGANIGLGKDTFEKMCLLFKDEGRLQIWKAYVAGDFVGVSLFFKERDTVYNMFSGLDGRYKNYYTQEALMHGALLYNLSEGLRVDLEGSMIKSIDRFYMEFNPIVKPYFQITKTQHPLLRIRNFIKNEI